jgi:hypothetical protein
MTKDEAIDLLDNLIGMVEDNHNSDYDTALQMAIEALGQEPCEDAISRQTVLDYLFRPYSNEELYSNIDIANFIKELPPVTPQTGHWIPSHVPESILDECSECGFSCGAFTFNYCPNCGAKMVEPQESEDKK